MATPKQKVRAQYSYTYDYEGTKISFKSGEEFQLLNKANTDWWQVRRWQEGESRDIYVPAVYMKEVREAKGKPATPLYENMADLKVKMRAKRENRDKAAKENGSPGDNGPVYDQPVVKPKPAPGKHEKSPPLPDKAAPQDSVLSPSHHPAPGAGGHRVLPDPPATGAQSNGVAMAVGKDRPSDEFPETFSTFASPKRSRTVKKPPPVPLESAPAQQPPPKQSSKGIHEGWLPGYSLPVTSAKPRTQSVNVVEGRVSPSSPTSVAPQPSSGGPRPTSPPGVKVQPMSSSGKVKFKVPPPVAAKKAPTARPRSMIVTGSSLSEPLSSDSGPLQPSSFLVPGGPEAKRRQEGSGGGVKTDEVQLPTKSAEGKAPDVTAPSPQAVLAGALKQLHNGSLPHRKGSVPTTSPPPSSSPPPLPEGWTEHKTSEGHTYYYHTAKQESSWSRPLAGSAEPVSTPTHSQGAESSPTSLLTPLEKVAPRGWTKEINPITLTPIYTNCRNGERWALACDSAGTYYYYNTANSGLTIGELPEILDLPHEPSSMRSASGPDNIYDRLESAEPPPKIRGRAMSESTSVTPPVSPKHRGSHPNTMPSHLELVASSLSTILNKHGYLSRKRIYDAQGKKTRGSWQKHYVVLQDHQLFFYADHRQVKESPGAKPQAVFSLLQCSVSPLSKEKKKNVFQVSSSLYEQFLLQAETAPLMNDWYATIQTAIDKANVDYRQNPENYSDELSPKFSQAFRRKSREDETLDEDPMDDMEISAADRSVRIRSRLRRLMARRPQIDALKKSGIIEEPLFGCDLTHLCERRKSPVPLFMVHFMEHIEKKGLSVVGLYRLSGNAASVQKLRCLVEQDELVDLEDTQWTDINIITGCLKLFLRELPDPLIPFRFFRPLIEVARNCPPALRSAGIAGVLKDLPDANYLLLKMLMQHLIRVVENGAVNKMQSTNLAIVFGPTIMRAETDSLEMATLMPVQNSICDLMLTDFDAVFRK